MRRALGRAPSLLLGIAALLSGGWLFFALATLPWRLGLALWPLYAGRSFAGAMGVAFALAGAAAGGLLLRCRKARRLPWGTALAAAACAWLFLWGLFPADARQVPPLLAAMQAFAALFLVSWGLARTTGGHFGRAVIALWRRVLRIPTWLFLAGTCGAAFAAALAVGLGIFHGAPVLIDGSCYLYLAHLMCLGRVTGPVPVPPDLVDAVNIPYIGGAGAWFIQHPPGFPALLALGVLAGRPWIVNPLLQAVLVWLLHGLGRELGGRTAGRGAALLGATSPLLLLYSGTFMAHTAAMAALAGFAWAALRCRRRGWAAPVWAGALLGAALTIRPYSALLVALPFAVSGLNRLARRPRWHAPRLLAVGLGLLPFLVAFALYNQAITGSPWKLGYQMFHGFGHNLGFGQRGFFDAHEPFTAWMGLVQSQYRVGYVQHFLLLWPVPLFLLLLLAFRVRAGRIERLLLASLVCIVLGYAAYFNRGDWVLDPRFLLEAGPGLLVVAVLAVRRAPLESTWRATLVAVAALSAVCLRTPEEIRRVGAFLMRDRERVDRALEALAGRPGILFLERGLYLAAPAMVADPLLTGPLLRAKACGRADDRIRALFPDRPAAFYLAEDPGGLTLYEEVARLEELALRSLPGNVPVRKHVELGRENHVLSLRAGEPLYLAVAGGSDRALAWGWTYDGPPNGGELVVRAGRGGEVVVRGGPAGEWRLRSGFLPLPAGAESVVLAVRGAGCFGVVNPDLVRARIVRRWGGAEPAGRGEREERK